MPGVVQGHYSQPSKETRRYFDDVYVEQMEKKKNVLLR